MHLFEELDAAFASYQPQSVILSVLKDKLKNPSLLYLMNLPLGSTTFGYSGGGTLLHVMLNKGYLDCVAYLLSTNKTTQPGSGNEYRMKNGKLMYNPCNELIPNCDFIWADIFLQDDLGRNAFELAASKGFLNTFEKLFDFETVQTADFSRTFDRKLTLRMATYHAQASLCPRHPLLAAILDPLALRLPEFEARIQQKNLRGFLNQDIINRLRLLSTLVEKFSFYPIRAGLSDMEVLAKIIHLNQIRLQSDESNLGFEHFEDVLKDLFGDLSSIEAMCQIPHEINKPTTLIFHHGLIDQKIKRDQLTQPKEMTYTKLVENSNKLEILAPKLRFGFR